MARSSLEPFRRFLTLLPTAVNESQKRHAFTVLAATGFEDDQLATNLALGAEYQVRFQRSGLVRRGAVDAYFGNIVLEFENDLRATRDHALNQLRAYVAGAWNEDGNMDRSYLAVATDGLRWEVYTPRLGPGQPLDAANVALEPADTWVGTTPDDAYSLRDFLNRLLFRKYLLPPTASNFARDFGRVSTDAIESPAYVAAVSLLHRKYTEIATHPQLQVLQNAWSHSLQIAYGSVDTDAELFVRHTYLANLARLLVWVALEHRAPRSDDLHGILSGQYFRARQVANLVEDDFFKWHMLPSRTDANRAWTSLGTHLAGYDLKAIKEDVLKPLYESLVDPVSRHDLGEYYTPEWLADRTTQHVLSDWDWTHGPPAILDPTCGSGTFLRVAIDLIRDRIAGSDQSQLDAVLSHVFGIDVHPLAVVTARATYLLAIADLLPHAREAITLPIFLANSLLLSDAEWQLTLFQQDFELQIAEHKYSVPLQFVREGPAYDDTLEDVLTVARSFASAARPHRPLQRQAIGGSLRRRLANRLDHISQSAALETTLQDMAYELARLMRDDLDSIHGFLLKNHYRPAMLRGRFDYIVGNPPWLTISSIRTDDYQELVLKEAERYGIASSAAGERGHIELASIFLLHVISVFLKPNARNEQKRVALVMPRSLFNASQHRFIRERRYTVPMRIAELWDLEEVAPLFNVPACVVFAAYQPSKSGPIPGIEWSGRLPMRESTLSEAAKRLTATPVTYDVTYLGRRSAWTTVGLLGERTATYLPSARPQYYVGRFEQGAILYPQRLLVVVPKESIVGNRRSVLVCTDEEAAESARLLTAPVNHIVNVANLYHTAAAEHILPYALTSPLWTVVLPTMGRPGEPTFRTASPHDLRLAGLIETAEWLDWAESEWVRVRRAGEKLPLHQRLNHMNHVSDQAVMKRHVVLFTASGSRPVGAHLDTATLDFSFVARDKTYWTSSDSTAEPHYLLALLNSEYAAERIAEWMTRGLFGARDVQKRILDVPWPAFDPSNADHQRLAHLSATLESQARTLALESKSMGTGKRRVWLRRQLSAAVLKESEMLVERLSRHTEQSFGR